MKKESEENVMEQFVACVSLLAEMRFKLKEGIHKTFFRVIDGDKLTVPMCEIGTKFPFGSLTDEDPREVIDMR